MNDKQFDALLDALSSIAGELMILRDEVTGLRDVYAIAHGIETSDEQDTRVEQMTKDGSLFADLESPIGGDA